MTINHQRRKLLILGMGMALTAPRVYAKAAVLPVTLTSGPEKITISLPATDKRSRVFTLDSPHRVVIDVPLEAFPPSLVHSLTVLKQKFPWLVHSQIAHFTPEITRVVLEVNAAPRLQRSQNAGSLTVNLTVPTTSVAENLPA